MLGECLIIQHVASEPPGTIEAVLQSRQIPVRKIEVFSGQEIPASAADLHSLVVMGGPMGLGDLDRLPLCGKNSVCWNRLWSTGFRSGGFVWEASCWLRFWGPR